MARRMVPSVLCALLLAGALSLSQADAPRVQQTVPRAERLTALAVSPTGNQLAVADAAGIVLFSLRPNTGSIVEYPAVASMLLSGVSYLAFGPNGKFLFAAANDGLVHRIDRSTWDVTTRDLQKRGRMPWGIFLLENPTLMFLPFAGDSEVTVLDYTRLNSPVEKVPIGIAGYQNRGDVLARADAGSVLWGIQETTALQRGSANCAPYRGSVSAWRHQFPSATVQLAMGPDPTHVLATSEDAGILRIFQQDRSHDSVIGCELPDFHPVNLAFTNDGYYAVLVSLTDHAVMVVSGHDLRARLDPNANLPASRVRKARLDLFEVPGAVALHPTLPMAYLMAPADKKILRVSLAIPGIEHP